MRKLMFAPFLFVIMSNVVLSAPLCSQLLSSGAKSQIKISASDLENKIHDLTTLKILWDKRQTGALNPAEIAIAKYYPKREQELLQATGMTREQLHELLKQETLKRQGRQSRTNEEEKDKREKETDDVRINDPDYLAEHLVFHEVKPGEFLMGEPGKQIKTEITKPFAMMATQVTQFMWAKLKIAMGEKDLSKINPSHFKAGTESMTVNIEGIDVPMKPGHPVEEVDWNDVKEFIDGLNFLSFSNDVKIQAILAELIPGNRKGDIYDFPTEAQWEFVMRDSGNANKIYFDRDSVTDLTNYARFDKNSVHQTHAVATLYPRISNGKPFYDLEGNVWEWTKDTTDEGSGLPGGKDPIGTVGTSRAMRGGGWFSGTLALRSAFRFEYHPGYRNSDVGFRLVRTRP